jgi:hypothetical protein
MDILFPAASSHDFRSLFQCDEEGDAEFYVSPGNGIGIQGDYAGNVTPDTWHRIAFAVDVSGQQPAVRKYVDGSSVVRQVLRQGIDGRWSLGSVLHLFADPASESQAGYINSLQIRDRALSEGELAVLGGPASTGIPTNDQPAGPIVERRVPSPGAFGAAEEIEVEILEGQAALERETMKLIVNQESVRPGISRMGNRVLVRHRLAGPLQSTNTVVLIYKWAGQTTTNAWEFMAMDQPRGITGQWDFERGDLSATIGSPLQYWGGSGGASRQACEFGSTTSFGISDIANRPARVLRFHGAATRDVGLLLTHGALPNGGGNVTGVNQWTLIMDLLVPNSLDEPWLALLQTDLNNTSDTDFCVNFVNKIGGIGILGQYGGEGGNGGILPQRWHRVAVVVDATTSTMEKYIDGSLFAMQELSDSQLNGRYSLPPKALLLADDNGESQEAYFNSIQIRNYLMSSDEVRALGGATAQGISTNASVFVK